MNILVVAFDLGVTSSGIVTDRLCKQFSDNGHLVRVITSQCTKANRSFDVCVASPYPLKPARLYSVLGNAVGRDLNYLFWERRAVRFGMSLIGASRPDVIYARSSPGCALPVGRKLSSTTGVPLAIHFADPIPATPDWQKSLLARRKHLRTILPAQRQSALVTIVNRRMLDYQQETTGEALLDKSLILSNPIPEPLAVGPMPSGRFVFSFLGSFFGSRQPDSLLAGFADVAKRHPDVDLHLYGTWPSSLPQTVMADPLLRNRVSLKGWTHDMASAIARSSCLVDVDADSVHAVYTSNKLMDYLSTDRPILLISPLGSASRDLLKDLSQSCFAADHNKESIVVAMEAAIAKRWRPSDFVERRAIRRTLSLRATTALLETRLEALTRVQSEIELLSPLAKGVPQ
jgi:glycosyltransferase involved in cell wall biosynthesis